MQGPSSSQELTLTRAPSGLNAQVLAVFGLIALVPLLFWVSTRELLADWTDLEDLGGTHGLLLTAVSAWLLFGERRRLAAAAARPSALGAIALLFACFVWLILNRAALEDPEVSMLPGLILLAVFTAFGWNVTRVVFFPVGFLFFAVPLWNLIKFPLQMITVKAVDALAWVTGLPAIVDGIYVTVPSGRFAVEGGCSGHHFMVVGLATAALYGHIIAGNVRTRVKLLVTMAGLAMLCNWIRVFSIVAIGYATNMKTPLIHSHYWYGWAIFALALTFYLWLFRNIPDGVREKVPESPGEKKINAVAIVGATAILAAAPLFSYAMETHERAQSVPFDLVLPAGEGGWMGPQALAIETWQPHFPAAQGRAHGAYDAAGRQVEVAAYAYRSQRQGSELITDGNSVTGEEGSLKIEETSVATSHGISYDEYTVLDYTGARSIIWSTYLIGDRAFSSDRKAQLWYGVRSLTGAPMSSLLAVRASCDPDCNSARRSLDSFLQALGPPLVSTLTKAPAAAPHSITEHSP